MASRSVGHSLVVDTVGRLTAKICFLSVPSVVWVTTVADDRENAAKQREDQVKSGVFYLRKRAGFQHTLFARSNRRHHSL